MNKYTRALHYLNGTTEDIAEQIYYAKLLKEELIRLEMDPAGADLLIYNLTNTMGAALVLQKGIIALGDEEEAKLKA